MWVCLHVFNIIQIIIREKHEHIHNQRGTTLCWSTKYHEITQHSVNFVPLCGHFSIALTFQEVHIGLHHAQKRGFELHSSIQN